MDHQTAVAISPESPFATKNVGTRRRARRAAPALALLASLSFLLVAPAAHADIILCNDGAGHYLFPFSYCAATSGNDVVLPDAISAAPVEASGGSGGPGTGTFEHAAAGPGALHATAMAFVTAPPPLPGGQYTSSYAQAIAGVSDSGFIVDPTHTLAVGTPVVLTVTTTVEGSFTTTGEADTTFALSDDFVSLLSTSDAAFFGHPRDTARFSVVAAIGDHLDLTSTLHAYVGAGNGPLTGLEMGTADAGNTAFFNLDFLDSDVIFASASGFDYATGAVVPLTPGAPGTVPEPVSPALLAVGAVAWVVRRGRPRVAAGS